MILRDYQEWGVEAIWKYFEENDGNPVIAMPTGTGKSLMIAGLLQRMLFAYPGTRAMVATHVKELIQQNMNKFIAMWPNAPAGIFSAGLNKKEFHQPITFCGIGSVVKQAQKFGHIDILFIDECDLVSPTETTMYQKFITSLRKVNPYLKVIGLTATPWRAGLGSIVQEDGNLFTDVAVDMTGIEAFNWFIQEGYLVPLVPKKTTLELDITGVHMRGGELIQSELQTAVDKADITMNALRETMELAYDRRKWLIFASGVDHAKHIADMSTDLGVSCKAVFSGMGEAERAQTLHEHRTGKIKAIVNNNILTTGYDDPEIDLILMLRPTASARLWVQMLGRGTRPHFAPGYDISTRDGRLAAIAASPKQNTLVLDFAGNTRKLGAINDPVIPRKKGEKAGEAPVKMCTACGVWNHASARYCGGEPFVTSKGCGTEFVFITKLKVEASTQELIKGDFPIMDVFKVDHITYSLHQKADKPDAFKVTYYCKLTSFTEFVCPEHQNYAGVKAKEWWRMRSKEKMPATTEECLLAAASLPAATHLKVWINKKWPEIMQWCFDGTAFGTVDPTSVVNVKPPTTQMAEVKHGITFTLTGPRRDDDDVPDITRRFSENHATKPVNYDTDEIPF